MHSQYLLNKWMHVHTYERTSLKETTSDERSWPEDSIWRYRERQHPPSRLSIYPHNFRHHNRCRGRIVRLRVLPWVLPGNLLWLFYINDHSTLNAWALEAERTEFKNSAWPLHDLEWVILQLTQILISKRGIILENYKEQDSAQMSPPLRGLPWPFTSLLSQLLLSQFCFYKAIVIMKLFSILKLSFAL